VGGFDVFTIKLNSLYFTIIVAIVCIDIPTQCYKYYVLIKSEYITIHLNCQNFAVIRGKHGAGAGDGFR
jgi:hypothetical protein